MSEISSDLATDTSQVKSRIADHFSGRANPLVEIEVLTAAESPCNVWAIQLMTGDAEAFKYQGYDYCVRHAVLSNPEQSDILCQVGFSPETGRFLKLLPYKPRGYLTLWLASGPLTHLLYLEPTR